MEITPVFDQTSSLLRAAFAIVFRQQQVRGETQRRVNETATAQRQAGAECEGKTSNRKHFILFIMLLYLSKPF